MSVSGPIRYSIGDDPPIKYWFAKILVMCPACGKRAKDQCVGDDLYMRCLACEYCGYIRTWRAEGFAWGSEPVDPFSECPLWLCESTPKGPVFAYNGDNLEALRNFIAADLRERKKGNYGWSNQGYFSRLPKWMKERSNREMILRKIEKMESRTKQGAKSL